MCLALQEVWRAAPRQPSSACLLAESGRGAAASESGSAHRFLHHRGCTMRGRFCSRPGLLRQVSVCVHTLFCSHECVLAGKRWHCSWIEPHTCTHGFRVQACWPLAVLCLAVAPPLRAGMVQDRKPRARSMLCKGPDAWPDAPLHVGRCAARTASVFRPVGPLLCSVRLWRHPCGLEWCRTGSRAHAACCARALMRGWIRQCMWAASPPLPALPCVDDKVMNAHLTTSLQATCAATCAVLPSRCCLCHGYVPCDRERRIGASQVRTLRQVRGHSPTQRNAAQRSV